MWSESHKSTTSRNTDDFFGSKSKFFGFLVLEKTQHPSIKLSWVKSPLTSNKAVHCSASIEGEGLSVSCILLWIMKLYIDTHAHTPTQPKYTHIIIHIHKSQPEPFINWPALHCVYPLGAQLKRGAAKTQLGPDPFHLWAALHQTGGNLEAFPTSEKSFSPRLYHPPLDMLDCQLDTSVPGGCYSSTYTIYSTHISCQNYFTHALLPYLLQVYSLYSVIRLDCKSLKYFIMCLFVCPFSFVLSLQHFNEKKII